MENPRPEKVAVVDEVRGKLTEADAALLTEYRGLTVKQLADLRRQLRPAGGEYKIYKNTLVRFAARDVVEDRLDALLTGPTAIAFVRGDVAAAAKALRDYSRTNQALVLKGGLLGATLVSPKDIEALADLPSRDVLLAQIAGAFQAPLAQLAGLLQALPRNFAYGLKALIDERGGAPEPTAPEPEPAAPEANAPEANAPEVDAPEVDAPEVDAPEVDAPEAAPPAEAVPPPESGPPADTADADEQNEPQNEEQ